MAGISGIRNTGTDADAPPTSKALGLFDIDTGSEPIHTYRDHRSSGDVRNRDTKWRNATNIVSPPRGMSRHIR